MRTTSPSQTRSSIKSVVPLRGNRSHSGRPYRSADHTITVFFCRSVSMFSLRPSTLTAHQTVARDGYSRQTMGLNDNELTQLRWMIPAGDSHRRTHLTLSIAATKPDSISVPSLSRIRHVRITLGGASTSASRCRVPWTVTSA